MMNKIATFLVFVFMMCSSMFAQFKHVDDLLKAPLNDANILAGEYLRPYGEMLGVNLNSGWYNTAKVHKLGGFDLTLMGTFSTAPSSKGSFNSKPDGLSDTFVPQNSSSPTVAGSTSDVTKYSNQATGVSFEIKGGGGKNFITPMIQGAVGLPFHTEIMGRYMPKVEYGDLGKAYMYGFGLKHSLKDYIPFVKRTPFLQLSVLAAYTHFDGALSVSEPDYGSGEFTTQSNAFTSRLLIGVNVPVVSFYTGLGYGRATTNFGLDGNFKVGEAQELKVNPLGFEHEYSGFDMNAGMRVRIGILALHADYTIGDYTTITAGLGISFR